MKITLDSFNKTMVGVLLGMIIGMFVQCIYDYKHIEPRTIHETTIDTLIVQDTIGDTVRITKYQPIPMKEYKTKDTVYVENKPIVREISHKVYDNTIDTFKTLQDTIKYHQTISYHITTKDTDVDTIDIRVKERIPYLVRYVENRTTEYVAKKPKFTVSVGGGMGWNTNGTITPNLGIFVGYPIFSK